MRRAYAPASGKSDVDAFERVARFRVLGWSIVGAFLGFLLGVFITVQGRGGGLIILGTTFIGWLTSYIGPLLIMRVAGRAGSTLYAPSGKSTPRKKEYSLAESYAARGEYEMAIDAFEDALAEAPWDPTPYLRIARLSRDKTEDAEGAARWFKRALAESTMPPGVRLLTMKELVELYELRLGEVSRAAPLLARVAEEHADTPDGEWAAETLARIKRGMTGESGPR